MIAYCHYTNLVKIKIQIMESFGPQGEKMNVTETESAKISLTDKGGLKYYEAKLRLTQEDLAGKNILDLGSGQESRFAQDVREQFPGTNVISLDYSFDRLPRQEFGLEPIRAEEAESREKTKDLTRVRGLFTKLPFADNSFDTVVSSGAMPLYLTNLEQIEEAFSEVIRVLKQGGKAHIGPISYTDVFSTDPDKMVTDSHLKHSEKESQESFTEILKKYNNEASFEFLAGEEVQTGRVDSLGYPRTEWRPKILILTKNGSRDNKPYDFLSSVPS